MSHYVSTRTADHDDVKPGARIIVPGFGMTSSVLVEHVTRRHLGGHEYVELTVWPNPDEHVTPGPADMIGLTLRSDYPILVVEFAIPTPDLGVGTYILVESASEIPRCDILHPGGEYVAAYADASIPTAGGRWGHVCRRHFDDFGCRLGTGLGQRYVVDRP